MALTSVIARLFAAFAAAGLASVLVSAPALSQAFEVSGVEIDATANTAFEAQSRALTDGQVRAAERLVRRLTLPEDRAEADLPPMTSETAAGLIAGLQISDEQRSATRYRGVLAVTFDRRAVRDYFARFDVPFVESQAAPILAVPVLEGEAGARLGAGPWHRAWREGGFDTALAPFIALGSRTTEDGAQLGLGSITAAQALSLNESALSDLAETYGVDRVAVIIARRGGEAVRASGTLVTFTSDGARREALPTVAARGGFAAAARRLVELREEDWKRASVVRGGDAAELSLTLLFESITQWRALQRAVAGASLVQDARLDALSRSGAAMTISHRGTRNQVSAELAARGARLEQDEELGWTVRPR